MITQATLDRAVKLLIEAAHPQRIILFGSYARNEAGIHSDVDFLVIEKKVKNKIHEMIRLKRVLRQLEIPVDVIVSSIQEIDDWGHLPGTALYWALKEGKVLHEEAA